MKNTAILLAAGSGSRMRSNVKKQYMLLAGKPVIYYSLKTFQESFLDEIILVCSPGDEDYCRREIVEKYAFDKVSAVIPGGEERYHSVYNGICKAVASGADRIYIHDGARAFVTLDILQKCREAVEETGACVAAVPSKDTIKLSDGGGFVEKTLDRSLLWNVQTPQVFKAGLIKDCYEKLISGEAELKSRGISITDDTFAVEYFTDVKVKLVESSYNNIKITTPEDMQIGERIIGQKRD